MREEAGVTLVFLGEINQEVSAGSFVLACADPGAVPLTISGTMALCTLWALRSSCALNSGAEPWGSRI